MPRTFDVIVVGARCAGSSLAMLLARRGLNALVVDKAAFPQDTVSTHLIWHAGLTRAKRWGLLDRIRALGAPPIPGVRMDLGEFQLAGSPPPLDGIDYMVAPRRTVLDALLQNAAVEAGAEVREGFHVREVMIESGRVTGIRGRTAAGKDVDERAAIVVGADGTHSMVASAVRAPKYHKRPSSCAIYYTYWRGGPEIKDFEVSMRENFGTAAIPTNDGLTCVGAAFTASVSQASGGQEAAYRRCLRSVPRMAEFLERGEQAEPLAGMPAFPGFFRRPWGPGWALVGDAGYHKNALTAQGITDAFRDADLLSEAIASGIYGERPMNEALACYEKQRNEAVMPMYESTCERAKLAPPTPDALALFRALRTNQRETDRFFGTDAGTVPIPEFFAPENIKQIMRSAPMAAGSGA